MFTQLCHPAIALAMRRQYVMNKFHQDVLSCLNLPLQQSRMEERLDDAIHVLRTHAEGSLPPGMSPVVANSLLSAAAAGGAGVPAVGYSTSVGSSVASVVQPMDQMVSPSVTM